MIDRDHALSVTKQAEAAGLARSTVYYLPRPVPAADLALMRQIDQLHLEFPFAGSRMLRRLLAAKGSKAGRRHIKTLMRRMGVEALYRRPRTTKPEPGHKVYPYLLRGMEIVRPNQVWAMDITYIPMAKGFVYLAAVLDWFSRRALSWRVSITMEASFCVEALQDALARHGRPEIFNTDQGSQFTGTDFTGVLIKNEIAISMDGKGAWRDNVFVERLWRTVKYEEVYLHGYDSVSDARASIGRYLDLYNRRRPHSSLDGMTPDQAYYGAHSLPPVRLAANPGRRSTIEAENLSEQAEPPKGCTDETRTQGCKARHKCHGLAYRSENLTPLWRKNEKLRKLQCRPASIFCAGRAQYRRSPSGSAGMPICTCVVRSGPLIALLHPLG